jgi:hypothetical protein
MPVIVNALVIEWEVQDAMGPCPRLVEVASQIETVCTADGGATDVQLVAKYLLDTIAAHGDAKTSLEHAAQGLITVTTLQKIPYRVPPLPSLCGVDGAVLLPRGRRAAAEVAA